MEKYPHLAAIPTKVTDPANHLSSIWWTPSRGDFIQSLSSGLSGLGSIACREMEELEHCKRDIMHDAHEYLERHPEDVVVLAARSATAFSWVQLSTLLGEYEEKALEISEFQRNWLDLYASLDYLQIYHPRMYSNDGYASVEPRIGCFTTQPIVIQEFYSAGIPVWLICSQDSIGPEICITKICSMSEPPRDIRICVQIGDTWVGRFLERYRDRLQMHWSKPLDTQRAQSMNPEAKKKWFELLEEFVVKAGIRPEDLYGMDETGCPPSDQGTKRVCGGRGTKTQHKQGGADRENVTAIITICADGMTLRPTIIFKGQNFMTKWADDNVAKAS